MTPAGLRIEEIGVILMTPNPFLPQFQFPRLDGRPDPARVELERQVAAWLDAHPEPNRWLAPELPTPTRTLEQFVRWAVAEGFCEIPPFTGWEFP